MSGFFIPSIGPFGRIFRPKDKFRAVTPVADPFVVFSEIDATSDANLVFGVSPAVQQMNDVSGNNHPWVQAAGAAQADRLLAAVNGENVIEIGNPNGLDFYTMSNALGVAQNVGGLFGSDMILIPSLSENWLAWLFYTNNGLGLISLTFLTSGKMRLASRRFKSDAPINTTSVNAVLTAGVQSFYAAGIDWRTGRAFFQVDGNAEWLPVGPSVWASGLGPTEDLPANTPPRFGRLGAAHSEFQFAMLQLGSGIPASFAARRSVIVDTFNTPLIDTAVEAFPSYLNNRIYRLGSGSSYTLSVVLLAVGTDSEIETRFVDAATLAAMPGAAGNWVSRGTTVGGRLAVDIDFPPGSTFLQTRRPGQLAASAYTWSNRVGVGYVGVNAGYSDERNMWSNGSADGYPVPSFPASGVYLNPRRFTGQLDAAYPYGYFDVTQNLTTNQNATGTGEIQTGPLVSGAAGNGLAARGVQFGAYTVSGSVPSGLPLLGVAVAFGGSTIDQWKPGGTCYQQMVSLIGSAGGPGTDVDFVTFKIGLREAISGMTQADFYTDLDEVVTGFRSLFGAGVIVGIGVCGASAVGGMTAANLNAIRRAQMEYIADNASNGVVQLAMEIDQPPSDASSHYNGTSMGHFGYRDIATLATALGEATFTAVGGKISSATCPIGGDTITLVVDFGTDEATGLVDGNDDPDGAGLTGFVVKKNGAEVPIATAVLVAGVPQITVTGLNRQPADTITVEYAQQTTPPTYSPTYVPLRGNVDVAGDTIGAPLNYSVSADYSSGAILVTSP